ncbi:MAG: hypothetical protein HY600_04255 [Candidatus Omnitrophica bacterium]|nr:hypothetical protein [Candidatus Omnitrophota bacterium]
MAIGVVALGAGWWEWDLSWAAPRVSAIISRWTGWSVDVGQLWVTPWRGARARDVKITPAGGGRLHAQQLAIRYTWSGTRPLQVTGRWQARQIHLDPGSWKIHRPDAVAMLSRGPIVDTWHGRLTVRPGRLALERVRILGWTMRGHGGGAWGRGLAHYWLRGQVASPVLEALGIRRTRGAWESCWFRADGPARRPAVSFRSRVLSVTLGSQGGV